MDLAMAVTERVAWDWPPAEWRMAQVAPGQAHHIVHQFGLDVHPGSLILELRQLPKGENRANLQKGLPSCRRRIMSRSSLGDG